MKVSAFFQLIRWKNLLIIFSTQVLIKFILIPTFVTESSLSNQVFFLVVFSTLFITSAGYIINDLFDINIDAINNKNSAIITKSITTSTAKSGYYIFTSLGLFFGIIASSSINKPIYSLFFLVIIILLYFYSKHLKSIALIGNITVSLLIGFSVLIIAFFEHLSYDSFAFKVVMVYSIFAFAINLIREIIKDIEDIDGDFSGGLKTLPILLGRKRTKTFIVILSSVLSISIIFLLFFNKEIYRFLFYYGFIIVLVPLLYFISKLTNAETKTDYKKLSTLLKIIMVLGILSVFTL